MGNAPFSHKDGIPHCHSYIYGDSYHDADFNPGFSDFDANDDSGAKGDFCDLLAIDK